MEPLESDFELLYRAQVQSIYRYALALTHNPALAEELTQEAFVRLLQSRAQLKHPGICPLSAQLGGRSPGSCGRGCGHHLLRY